jgi:transposase
MVYIDESGVEDTLFREYARAPRGEQVIADILGHRTQRFSVIAGLLGHKLIAPLVFEGYTDAQVFNDWVEQMLIPELPPGRVVIMDRASFHRKPRTRKLIEAVDCRLIYLPSYSSDFNKIESWWAVLKARIKAILKNADSFIAAIESAFHKMNYHKLHQSN